MRKYGNYTSEGLNRLTLHGKLRHQASSLMIWYLRLKSFLNITVSLLFPL